MNQLTVFKNKNYRQLDGKQKNELIRKFKRLLGGARFTDISEALDHVNPRVEECRDYLELTKVNIGDAGLVVSRIVKNHTNYIECKMQEAAADV